MAMEHWTSQDAFTQLVWHGVDEIARIASGADNVGAHLGLDEQVSVRASEGETALFFEVNGGDTGEAEGTGYTVVFETAEDSENLSAVEGVSFIVTDDVSEVEGALDVVKREVDGVVIHTVDAAALLGLVKEWFGAKQAG